LGGVGEAPWEPPQTYSEVGRRALRRAASATIRATVSLGALAAAAQPPPLASTVPSPAKRCACARTSATYHSAWPWSKTHWEESFVAAPFEELRRIYEHLAGDVSLQPPSYVKHGQVFHKFEQWLDAGSGRGPVTRDAVVRGNVDGWMPKLQVHARLDPDPNTADELRAARAESHQGLASAVAVWREGPRRGFDAYFRSEVAGYGEAELRAYGGRLQKALEISEGRRQIDEDILFATNSQILIERMKSKLPEQGVPHERQIETLYAFFRSEEMQRVPFLRTPRTR